MNLITDNVKRDSGSILWEGEDIPELGSAVLLASRILFSKKFYFFQKTY